MQLTRKTLYMTTFMVVLFVVFLISSNKPRATEVMTGQNSVMTTQELERRPIPGTDLEMRLNLVTQPPGYSEPLHHHPGPSFVYMLAGTAESAYGEDAVKRFHAGDHWSQPVDVPHRVARNPDKDTPRQFLVFTINHPGEPSTIFP